MRSGWALMFAMLAAGLACRTLPAPVAPSHEAEIRAVSAPGSPLEPTSPDSAQRQSAPFVFEVLDALVLADRGPFVAVLDDDGSLGPRSAHARRIERPPIPPRSSS